MKDMKKIFAIGVLLIFIFAFSTAAFAADAEDGVITLTPADLVNGASGEGWFFDGNLNIESGYTLVFDGECWYPVHNHGIIKDGTFGDDVNNHGTIEDGTFNGPVFNYGTIASGNFNGLLSNDAGIIEDGSFVEKVTNYGTIKGGTFTGFVENDVLIEGGIFRGNVRNTGDIRGGTFEGSVENHSNIFNGTFPGDISNYVRIEGGTFSGEVINEGVIGGGIFDNEVFNHGGGNIIDGTFTKQVTNDDTIEGGKFDCNVKNSRGGAIAGGSFGEGFSVENDGDIRGGNFDGSVSNNQNAVILTGVFTGGLSNNGKIEDGEFSGAVVNNQNATISGGVFTGSLFNHGTVTGTADLVNTYMRGNQPGVFGKDIILGKAEIRGELNYIDCDTSTEVTLHYYADGVKTAEWKVNGEKYSYKVEKYRRTDPEAELSSIVEIEHKVEADAIDGYEIIVTKANWDRFNVTVSSVPELTITGILDGDSFQIGANVPFTAIGKGMDNDAPVEGVYQYRPYYWKVLDASGEVVASGDWVENDTIEEHESYNASIDTDAMREGQYTLIVACSEWQRQSGVWTPEGMINPDEPGSAYSTISIAFELYCNEHTGGTATCSKKAVCETCGYEYGNYNQNNHDYGRWVRVYEPTETEEGLKVKTCRDCGKKIYADIKPLNNDGIEELGPSGKSENDFNPNTGAPVFEPFALISVFAVGAAIFGKRR